MAGAIGVGDLRTLGISSDVEVNAPWQPVTAHDSTITLGDGAAIPCGYCCWLAFSGAALRCGGTDRLHTQAGASVSRPFVEPDAFC